MYPIHEDLILTDTQKKAVLDYVRQVDFHLPGADSSDFTDVVARARYAGWDFMSEDLDAYAVGLICSKPGYEDKHTFIRMSYQQLTGDPAPKLLEVNEPVLASDTFRMSRWRSPGDPTGVDCFAADNGVGRDLRILGDTLADIVTYHAGGGDSQARARYDFAVDWGTLLAGRYARLDHMDKAGRLTPTQARALEQFRQAARDASAALEALALPTLETIKTPEKRPHSAHHSGPTPS